MTISQLLNEKNVNKEKVLKATRIMVDAFFELLTKNSDYLSNEKLAKHYLVFIHALGIAEQCNIELYNLWLENIKNKS